MPRVAGSDRDPLLAQDDHVFIREMPQWRSQELVKIEGQVMFPGVYALAHERETLWELMQRAGGLTDEAFIPGTIFTRKSITDYIRRADYQRIAESSIELREDTLGEVRPAVAVSVDPTRMTRLVIGMERLVDSRGEEGDIQLRDGDHIYIPREPSGVQVMGAVAAPGTIQYRPRSKIGHYIERAGDYTKQSQKDGARLIKADGRVFAGGEARSQQVQLGDAIFVPTEIKKDRDWWKIVTGSMTLITGMVTVAVLIAQL